MLDRKKNCSNCGAPLKPLNEGVKICCNETCAQKHYDNPIVGVAGIYIIDNKVLLGKRNSSFKTDEWCIPCGYLERENVEDGMIREFEEETGLIPLSFSLYSAHTNYDNPKQLTVGIYYLIQECDGELGAADDLSEVAFFSLYEIQNLKLAFKSDLLVMQKLQSEGLLL